MYKLVIEVNKEPKLSQKTLHSVLQKARELQESYNGPQPFGEPAEEVSMTLVESYMRKSCIDSTTHYRKGMMISSSFRVRLTEYQEVKVYQVNNVHEDDLFLTLKKVKQ